MKSTSQKQKVVCKVGTCRHCGEGHGGVIKTDNGRFWVGCSCCLFRTKAYDLQGEAIGEWYGDN